MVDNLKGKSNKEIGENMNEFECTDRIERNVLIVSAMGLDNNEIMSRMDSTMTDRKMLTS